jgi:hypothetical protein
LVLCQVEGIWDYLGHMQCLAGSGAGGKGLGA